MPAEQQYRATQHRKFVNSRFANTPLPQGKTAWDDGLMIVYTVGGASDHGRIHRASCPSISRVANATTYRKNGGTYTVSQHEGISAKSERCRTCQTEDLPLGAAFWGDTEQTITDRRAARDHAGRIKDYQRSMSSQVHVARNAAIAEVLAAHAAEVDALAAAHLSRLQDGVRVRFADVADEADQSVQEA